MRKLGRVLIVDDQVRWRDDLVEALQRNGFSAESASTAQEALTRLEESIYHVLVLDVRMDDKDQSNIDGFKLLSELDRRGLNETVKVLILSAYGTKEQMRIAFRDHKVADFLSKHRFNTRQFVETIQHIFEHETRINLNLDILWQQVDGGEQMVLNLELEEGQRVEVGSDLQKRAAQELEDLLCRLFYQAKSILVQPMVSGHSGTKVLWVQPFYTDGGGGQTVVIKFGNARKIVQEYHNYKRYVEPFIGGQRCTTILELRRTPLLGGIMYSLLGASGDQLEDFASFYHSASSAEIMRALDRLFTETCGRWYANPGNLQPRNLTEDYLGGFKITPHKLKEALRYLTSVAVVEGSRKLYFKSLEGGWREFTNPLLAIEQQSFVRPTYVSTTHGDCNQYNLLVDRDRYMWMIDFQRTSPSHVLRDVAHLDAIVRFQLLGPHEATLAERLTMEEALSQARHFSQVKELVGKFTPENEYVEKAYMVVAHLRCLGRQLISQNPSDDISEYYVALLYNALNMLRFRDLPVNQREHALLSASLLADQLGLQKKT